MVCVCVAVVIDVVFAKQPFLNERGHKCNAGLAVCARVFDRSEERFTWRDSYVCGCVCRKYEQYAELEADYASGALHPGDLKPAIVAQLNEILQPVRDHFVNDANAAALLKKVKSFKVSR